MWSRKTRFKEGDTVAPKCDPTSPVYVEATLFLGPWDVEVIIYDEYTKIARARDFHLYSEPMARLAERVKELENKKK